MPGTQTLSLPTLRAMTERGEIDTIIVAAPDMQGRLQGKRVMPKFFFSRGGAEGCAYLLATDVENRPVPGYTLVSWEQGYGDFAFTPDLSTLRLAPWQTGGGDRAVRHRTCRPSPRADGAAHHAAPSARAPGRARPHRLRRHRAGIHPVPQFL